METDRGTENYFFDFRHIRLNDVYDHPDGINDIQQRRIDGLIISEFISDVELMTIRNAIVQNGQNVGYPVRTGYTYPIAYFEADVRSRASGSMIQQFKEWRSERARFPHLIGIDIEARISTIFRSLSGGRDVRILEGIDGEGSYIPATLRVFKPGLGGIPVHCGNMFDQMLPNLYADLNQKAYTRNQLSYFTVIQTAETGGGLKIYDLEWEPGQRPENEHQIRLKDGSILDSRDPSSLRSFEVDLRPGDLIIFAAGQIWHRVESPVGDKDRITIGGFLGFTKEDDAVTFWS